MPHAPRRTCRTEATTARSGLTSAEVAILAFIMCLLVAAVLATGRTASSAEIRTISIRVEVGDTLWAIADRYPVEGLGTEQTARLVASLNDLDDATIVAGDVLAVPAPADTDSHLAMR